MADNFRFFQGQAYSLYGSGAIIGDTSITLKTMTDIDGNSLSMATDFGNIGFGTLEPGSGANEEQICFTGLVNNANGTVTLTGVSNVTFAYPYTRTSGLLKTHAGSTTFVISNTSGFYDELTSKNDDETINGLWTFVQYPQISNSAVLPTLDAQFATKKYVDDIVIAGSPDASTTVKGISKLSYAPVSPTDPIAVGTNDPRVPTGIPVVVAEGGTGKTSLTANTLLAGGTTSTGALQQVGAGTTTTVLHGNASGLPTFGAVSLTADVSGVLPVANGGTGQSTNPQNYSINADENVYTYFTFQIPAPFSATGIAGAWTNTNVTMTGGSGRAISTSNGSSAVFTNSTSIGSGTLSSSKKFKIKFKASIIGTYSTNDGVGIGIGNPTYNNSGNITGFQIRYFNGTLTFVNGNNSAETRTTMSGVTVTDWNLYEIVFDGTNAYCYVNGTLKATNSTNIPTSWNSDFQLTGTISGGTAQSAISPTIISLEQ